VGQYDFAFIIWSEPTEAWISRKVRGAERLHRYVDLGLHVPLWGAVNTIVPYRDLPWEREAYFLSSGRPELSGTGGPE
jgi:hypothetical protein